MKKIYLFLMQALLILNLFLAAGCSKDDDGKGNERSGGLYVGQSYQGGKVFYIDKTGKHGLIAAPNDETGRYNMGSEAISICKSKVLDGYNDWYLPNINELYKLYLNRDSVGGFVNDCYWSSSEEGLPSFDYLNFSNGSQGCSDYGACRVRAVRAF